MSGEWWRRPLCKNENDPCAERSLGIYLLLLIAASGTIAGQGECPAVITQVVSLVKMLRIVEVK